LVKLQDLNKISKGYDVGGLFIEGYARYLQLLSDSTINQ
jgi:hypothetical protein